MIDVLRYSGSLAKMWEISNKVKNVQVLFVVTLEDDVEARYREGLIVGLIIFKPLAKYFMLRNLNNIFLTKSIV